MNSAIIIPVLADQIGGTAEQWFWLLTVIGLVLGSVVLGIIFVIYMLVKWTSRKTAPIEYHKAIGYYEKDLAISIKKLGAEHPDVGMSYNNIAFAYYNKGDKEKAMGYYEKSLAIYLKALGAEHPDVGTIYNNIGGAYDNKGEYDKAMGYYEKSLAIRLKALGADHPAVGGSYNNIGLAYNAKGDKATAMAYLLKAKAIYLKKLGARHPSTKNVQEGIDSLK
jgi:tetratricopeptide (TPR) repeat protein